MDDFMLRAALAGMAVVIMTGLLGVFLLWRRMAYFGDALSHSALLGVALGVVFGTQEYLWVWLVCAFMAIIMVWVQHNSRLSNDTMLGILGHGSLALGLIALHFSAQQGGRSLEAYLFGDILLLQTQDVYFTLSLCVLVVGVLYWRWNALLVMTVHQDLAQAEGINTRLLSLVYMLLIALVVAVAMRVVGIFLLTSLLIIPAATARRIATSPEQMAVLAVVFGLFALYMGLTLSWFWDVPTGPSIVMVATLCFVLIQGLRSRL